MRSVVAPDGGVVSYIDDGAGEPLVMLHAWCGDSSHFAHQIDHFRSRHRVIVPDLPWHGESSHTDTLTIESMADAVISLCDQLGVNTAHFVGHSMGAFVAVKMTDKRRGLVRSLTAIDSALTIHTEWFAGLNQHLDALRGEGYNEAQTALAAAGLLLESDDIEVREKILTEMRTSSQPLLVEGQRTMIEFEKGEGDRIIAELAAPLTILSSQNPPSDLDRLRALLPEARFEQLTGYGHYLPMLAPESVNAIISETVAVPAASAK